MDARYKVDTVYDTDTGENLLITTLNLDDEDASSNVYLDEQTFTNYLDVLLHHKDNNICTITSSIVLEYFVIVDIFRLNYQIPDTLYGFINLCKMRPIAPEFYVIPLKIQYDMKSAHSNVMIVNMKNNHIEYFEPHGLVFNMDSSGYDMSNIVKQVATRLFPFHEFTVKNVSSQCPIGPQIVQSLANPLSGHCLAWSLLFIHMRLLNLHLNPELILSYLGVFNANGLDLIIRKYMSKLQTELMFFPTKQYDKSKTYRIMLTEEDEVRIRNKIAQLAHSLMNGNKKGNEHELRELLLYSSFPSFYETFFENVNNT
jgi:hypothetical protein